MAINPVALHRPESQTQLDIRKYEIDAGETPITVLRIANSLIGIEQIVVGHTQRADRRRCRLDFRKILVPGVRAFELVIEHRPRRMNMWLPPEPSRSRVSHITPTAQSIVSK